MMLHYTYNAESSLISFQLQDTNQPIPISRWTDARQAGADILLGWKEEEDSSVIQIDEITIALPINSLVSALKNDQGELRHALGLPEYFTGVLTLSDHGILNEEKYHIKYQWLKSNGTPYTVVNEQGCFIEAAGKKYLMPPHVWQILEEIERVNNSTVKLASERLQHIHQIQSLLDYLPESARAQIITDGRIRNIRLYYADAFQIEAETVADGYNALPVLKRAEKLSYDETQKTFSDLLTRSDLAIFHNHFRESTEARANYTLEAGRYLVISPKVHQALQIVHKVRSEPNEKRLVFLQNPRLRLEEELGEAFSGEALDAIFSDRVVGFGEKQKRVIPWIKIEGQVWWPAEETVDKAPWPRGIEIGDQQIVFNTPEELENFEKKAIYHVYEESTPFEYEGVSIPSDSRVIDGINAIKPQARPDKKTKEPFPNKKPPNADESSPKPMVLYIKENLQEKEYEAHLVKRRLPEFSLPTSVKSKPKEHQQKGIEWLARHYRAGSRGVLLADDMGLGKTFQVLAILAWIRELTEKRTIRSLPILVVAPTGLLENWITKEHDVHLFAPGLGEPVRAYGRWLKDVKKDWDFAQTNWILTTYDTLATYQREFLRQHYAVVVFDEMQRVKNPDTLATIAAKALHADFWIGMTGTPVENRLCDLWCVMDTLLPGLLGSIKEFSHRYEKAVTANPPDEKELEHLNYRIRIKPHAKEAPAIMLRRMKKDVLDSLPPKHSHSLHEKMPLLQAQRYTEALKQAEKRKGEPGAALQALHAMRYLSLHPDYKSPVMHNGDDAFIAESARLIATLRELDRIAKLGEKALIFLEPEAWHHAMPALLKRRYQLNNLPMIIMGDVKGSDRQKRVNQFQESPHGFDVMLLSPRAGGVGLTLTAANHVFHLTRWWNPAVEDQATDRIYRIGQEKEVHVYYPMAVHSEVGERSFDLVLDRLLQKKRKLSERVLWPPAGSQQDSDFLTNEVLWGKPGDANKINHEDVLSMHHTQFDDHVVQTIQRQLPWLRVEKTIFSHDGGADIVVKNRDGEIKAIIQCKHTSDRHATPSAYKDLKRALNHYHANQPWCVGVTSALRFQSHDYEWVGMYPKGILITGTDAIDCESIVDKLREYA